MTPSDNGYNKFKYQCFWPKSESKMHTAIHNGAKQSEHFQLIPMEVELPKTLRCSPVHTQFYESLHAILLSL